MSSGAVIKFVDVCFAYEQEEVLHKINMEVPEGSLVAMVGPNGGGKSTLIKLALGLLKPTHGNVCIFNSDPSDAQQRIGYVPQHLQFDPEFPVNVLDVVLMGRTDSHIFGPSRAGDKAAAMSALKRVNMDHKIHKGFSRLSGGERQRVLMAQALVSDPELMLLDEPTANVDSDVQRKIYDLLKALNESITIVAVSHNLSVVTRHATHLACVNRTASITPMADLTEANLRAVNRGDMTVLHHQASCQVIDPSVSIHEPHPDDDREYHL